MDTVSKTVAIFDFDNTLVKGDSLWPFLVAVAGWRRCVFALLGAVVFGFASGKDKRTSIKEYLLSHLIAGRRVDDLSRAIEKLKAWPKKREAFNELVKHHESGHRIVIASGSLNLYMPSLLEGFPYDDLLCTQMEVIDGVITGKMISGNCVRLRKAELVDEYLKLNGPFDDSWGYGNAPHDLPMLDLVKHRVVV